jgi:hypothetical protein
MRGMVASIGRRRGFAPALALLLLFRLLIPSGYMVAPDHSGRPGLALCAASSGAAVQPVLHDGHAGHRTDPAPAKPGERPCPFAALAAPPLPPTPPALPPRAQAAFVPPAFPAPTDLPRVAPAAPPPPARGPPPSV